MTSPGSLHVFQIRFSWSQEIIHILLFSLLELPSRSSSSTYSALLGCNHQVKYVLEDSLQYFQITNLSGHTLRVWLPVSDCTSTARATLSEQWANLLCQDRKRLRPLEYLCSTSIMKFFSFLIQHSQVTWTLWCSQWVHLLTFWRSGKLTMSFIFFEPVAKGTKSERKFCIEPHY